MFRYFGPSNEKLLDDLSLKSVTLYSLELPCLYVGLSLHVSGNIMFLDNALRLLYVLADWDGR